MRLINTHTLDIEEFLEPPEYGILSHRWGSEEVSFEEYSLVREEVLVLTEAGPDRFESYLARRTARIRKREGFKKIIDCCSFARHRGKEWVWIDTCCIDKRSSAELSEAINSMYRWYERSAECYVHLVDVTVLPIDQDTLGPEFEDAMKASSWFTRCWTLQELLAPGCLVFCNSTWQVVHELRRFEIGDTKPYGSWIELLEKITSIPRQILIYRGWILGIGKFSFSIAQKMAWASQRQATRTEDRAYSLLGLFNINMPLLYGEGSKAFFRLQRELMAQSRDESILAWSKLPGDLSIPGLDITSGRLISGAESGVLAFDVGYFKNCAHVQDRHGRGRVVRPPYTVAGDILQIEADGEMVEYLTNAGYSLTLYILRLNFDFRFTPRNDQQGRLALTVGVMYERANCLDDQHSIFRRLHPFRSIEQLDQDLSSSRSPFQWKSSQRRPFQRRRFYVQL